MYLNPVNFRHCFLLLTLCHVSVYALKDTDAGSNIYIEVLMDKYGDGNEMTFEGFEHLIHSLGLGHISLDHGIEAHEVDGVFKSIHSHHNHSVYTPNKSTTDILNNHGHSHNHDHHHQHNDHTHHSHDHNHDAQTHKHTDQHAHDHTHTHKNTKCKNKSKQITTIKPSSTPKPKTKGRGRGGYVYKIRTSKKKTTPAKTETNDTVKQPVRHESLRQPIANTSKTLKDKSDKINSAESGEIQEDTKVENTVNVTDEIKGGNNTRHIREVVHSDNEEEPCLDNNLQNEGVIEAGRNCLPVSYMLKLVTGVSVDMRISKAAFLQLCPILIQQMDSNVCHLNHDLQHESHRHDHSTIHTEKPFSLTDVPAKVWGFSSLAVLIISLVGLLGVAVIPIMQKVFYQHLLQFLVALAVGALSGDALLHLIPHALSGGHFEDSGGHSHGHDDTGHAHGNDDTGHAHDNSAIFKCLCGLMGLYFFYMLERCLHILTDFRKKKKNRREINGNKKQIDEEQMTHLKPEHTDPPDDTKVGHGHGHGHSHNLEDSGGSVSAVAWMVILGDGVHNFCDGLAIGAAFVSSITSGFSTTIAVFCHELPHEIGDFAMLLKSGMTAKQAIFYNIVSSILCFVGMLIGVAIGKITGASSWVFVIVAGMFLYIALVDMLPVLTSSPPDNIKDSCIELLLQLLGMLIGAGIMLVIALYEEHLQTILD